jgi:hypothetical protein
MLPLLLDENISLVVSEQIARRRPDIPNWKNRTDFLDAP